MRIKGEVFSNLKRAGVILLAACMIFTFPPRLALAAHGQGDGALDNPGHMRSLDESLRTNWITAFMKFSEQMSAVMMEQMVAVGAFLDAKLQLETQLLFQEKTAQAHKDYHPDMTMCRIGTNIRSLAASEDIADENARLLNMTMLRRGLLAESGATAEGPDTDLAARLRQFKTVYCDPHDANGYLERICKLSEAGKGRANKDINYTRTLEGRYTLDIDFTDDKTTPDEEDILALAKNLFNYYSFDRIPPDLLRQEYVIDDFLDMRSAMAIRGIAHNSFSHLVGQRAAGSGLSAPFMRNFLLEMGVPEEEVAGFIGEKPSYFAQMEVLTHKMFENPQFYVNLYTKPVNVERIGVSLQALKLMQDRDRYEASLRREMLISLLLELKIRDLQNTVTSTTIRSIDLSPGNNI